MTRTPEAGDLRPYRKALWRVIEGQARSSTLRLVDTFDEHDALEAMLEEAKPPVPEACAHLDYQFWSPFRYGRYPKASRFRRAGRTPGVWYGSEEPLTAVAETIWGNLRFYAASPGTPFPRKPVEYTGVQADIASPFALDLTTPPWSKTPDRRDPDDYEACLTLAEEAREAGAEIIRYASVRHPDHAPNAAVLTCAAFQQASPIGLQSWGILYRDEAVRAYCETTRQRYMLVKSGTRLAFYSAG